MKCKKSCKLCKSLDDCNGCSDNYTFSNLSINYLDNTNCIPKCESKYWKQNNTNIFCLSNKEYCINNNLYILTDENDNSECINKCPDNRKYIKYAKLYVKELFEFYKVGYEEKTSLLKRVIELLPYVIDCALDNPDIYIIYSYVLFVFIDADIIHVKDLEKLVNEDSIEEDIKIVSNILKKVCKLMHNREKFIYTIRNFKFVKNNEELFGWTEEDIGPEEEEQDDEDKEEKEEKEE